jgi:alkylated DNA nucleotide flippase Atl1
VGSVERGGGIRGRGDGARRRERSILERIRAIPPGFVCTYGDVSPGAPRVAGAVLSACHDDSLPWYRVVRADGSLAKGRRQRELLDAEGVPFRGARVDMRIARLPDGP